MDKIYVIEGTKDIMKKRTDSVDKKLLKKTIVIF